MTAATVHDTVHVSTSIARPAKDVYDFVVDPINLSLWASGLAHQPVQHIDGHWVVESPMGRVTVRFVPLNLYGILDHDVTLPDGRTVTNPMRVLPNGDGSDIVFTVRRSDGMSDDEFATDVDTVRRDLDTLRFLMEN
jgi:hypothetical protein